MITTVVMTALAVGSFTAWAITLAYKRGWLEKLQAKAPNDTLNQLFSCNYCLSWWLSVAVAIVLLCVTREWCMCFVPFVSTKISTLLLK